MYSKVINEFKLIGKAFQKVDCRSDKSNLSTFRVPNLQATLPIRNSAADSTRYALKILFSNS